MTTQQLTPAGPIDIYARVSRKGDKRLTSTAGQVEACRVVLRDRELPEGEALVDDGKSAWNPKVDRKRWAVLMRRLETGKSGGVIVFDLERFSRQPSEGERLIAAAERGLLVLDSDGEFDLTSASGKKAFRDAMAAAAYYSDRLSDRVRRGKQRKALAGEPNAQGPNHRPFGFEQDAVTVRESEAVILRALCEHFLHGDAIDDLVGWLDRIGSQTSYGGPWSPQALRQLLVRERNAGRLIHRGAVVAQLPGEPIIDADTFSRVVAKLAARRPGRPPSPVYLCSGIAVCGQCRTRLTGRPRRNVRPYADGEVKREYWCSRGEHGRPGCGKTFADQRALDEFARDLALAILSDPEHASQIEAAAAAHDEQADALDSLIAEAERDALAVGDRLGRGELSLARYDAITGPLDARLRELRTAREALGDAPRPDPARAGENWSRRWQTALPGERRDILRLALGKQTLLIAPAAPADRADIAARVSLV